jgi:hypothetical protein
MNEEVLVKAGKTRIMDNHRYGVSLSPNPERVRLGGVGHGDGVLVASTGLE